MVISFHLAHGKAFHNDATPLTTLETLLILVTGFSALLPGGGAGLVRCWLPSSLDSADGKCPTL